MNKLKSLKKSGLIDIKKTKKGDGKGTNIYCLSGLFNAPDAPAGSAAGAPQVVQQVHQGSAADAPQVVQQMHIQNTIKHTKQKTAAKHTAKTAVAADAAILGESEKTLYKLQAHGIKREDALRLLQTNAPKQEQLYFAANGRHYLDDYGMNFADLMIDIFEQKIARGHRITAPASYLARSIADGYSVPNWYKPPAIREKLQAQADAERKAAELETQKRAQTLEADKRRRAALQAKFEALPPELQAAIIRETINALQENAFEHNRLRDMQKRKRLTDAQMIEQSIFATNLRNKILVQYEKESVDN